MLLVAKSAIVVGTENIFTPPVSLSIVLPTSFKIIFLLIRVLYLL